MGCWPSVDPHTKNQSTLQPSSEKKKKIKTSFSRNINKNRKLLLQNIGNSCYLNTILQLFNSMTQLKQNIKEKKVSLKNNKEMSYCQLMIKLF